MGRQSSSKLMSRSSDGSEIVSIGTGTYNELTPSSGDIYIKSLYKPSSSASEMADISAYEPVSDTQNIPLIANAPNPRIANLAENDAQNLEVEPFKSSSRRRAVSNASATTPAIASSSPSFVGGMMGHFGTVTTCDAKDESFYCKFMRFFNVLMVIIALIAMVYIGYTLYKAFRK